MNRTQIIERALVLGQAVAGFVARVRQFFHAVVLSDRVCLECNGFLEMESEGRCRCRSCGRTLDPTVTFQQCASCGGKPRLRIRHYECGSCGAEIVSRYLFDGLAFDGDYFRRKMAEHRRRKQEQHERVRQMLAETRSGILSPPAAELDTVPGLVDALNALTAGAESPVKHLPHEGFELKRYEAHIQARIGPSPLNMEEIPTLSANARNDRIWRFIAIIFLAHAGIIEVWQADETIMVKQREANREGQELPGDLQETDGVEGPAGRAEV